MLCFAQFMHAEMFPDMTIFQCKNCALKYICDLPQKEKIALTNADRIRAMAEEELAEFISSMASCSGCKAKMAETSAPCKGLYAGCKGNWLDWLRQELEA